MLGSDPGMLLRGSAIMGNVSYLKFNHVVIIMHGSVASTSTTVLERCQARKRLSEEATTIITSTVGGSARVQHSSGKLSSNSQRITLLCKLQTVKLNDSLSLHCKTLNQQRTLSP